MLKHADDEANADEEMQPFWQPEIHRPDRNMR